MRALALTAETGGAVAMLVNLLSLCHPPRHDFCAADPPPQRLYPG